MLVPDRLTVEMTVKIGEAVASTTLRINSLEVSLMIEWGRFRDLSGSIANYREVDPMR